jgi:hypothetical protein
MDTWSRFFFLNFQPASLDEIKDDQKPRLFSGILKNKQMYNM